MGNYIYNDRDKFTMLMINNETFRHDVIKAVRENKQTDLESILSGSNITLTANQISPIMNWPVDEPPFVEIRDIPDISRKVYDPDSGCW